MSIKTQSSIVAFKAIQEHTDGVNLVSPPLTPPSNHSTLASFSPVVSLKRTASSDLQEINKRFKSDSATVSPQNPHPFTLPPLNRYNSTLPQPVEPRLITKHVSSDDYLRKVLEPALPAKLIEFGSFFLPTSNPDAGMTCSIYDSYKSDPEALRRSNSSFNSNYQRYSATTVLPSFNKIKQQPQSVMPASPRRTKKISSTYTIPSDVDANSARTRKSSSRAVAAAAASLLSVSSSAVTPMTSVSSTPVPGSPLVAATTTLSGSAIPKKQPKQPKQPRPPKQPRAKIPRTPTSVTATKVHDMDTKLLPSYYPSADTLLPGQVLTTEWKGAPMDMNKDAHLHLLHPKEYEIAAILRLNAELYMDSKKRLFAEKVQRMRLGLPFRRTDAQKACRIDVNKASRLFTAYEKVGWLNDDLYKKYL
jgi:hypothetical protein